MHEVTWVLMAIVAVGLIFDYTNGFHDSANAIATSIGTRALTPGVALTMAAVLNVVGGIIFETNVANTMTKIVTVDAPDLVLAALLGAISWNILTWYFGIPSSSSHALIGGMVGAAIAATFSMDTVKWSYLWAKVIIPNIASPILGFAGGVLVTTVLYRVVHDQSGFFEKAVVRTLFLGMLTAFFTFLMRLAIGDTVAWVSKRMGNPIEIPWWVFAIPSAAIGVWFILGVVGRGPALVNGRFRHLQTLSAGFMALEHGHNDAQKTMGIITLALIGAHHVKPGDGVPMWVKLACATVMGLGTFTGGKRIIKTMGMSLVKLEPIDGFAAETVAGSVIQVAGGYGMPISTTHAITAAITGVGATKRISAVHWGVTGTILTAWVFTLPAAALASALAYAALRMLPH